MIRGERSRVKSVLLEVHTERRVLSHSQVGELDKPRRNFKANLIGHVVRVNFGYKRE